MKKLDKHRLQVLRGSAWTDISERVGEVALTDEMNTLSTELTFETSENPLDRYNPVLNLAVGDRVRLINGWDLIFQGVITAEDLRRNYIAHDLGWYLGKSELVHQCSGVRADVAVRQLCSKAGIMVGSVPAMAISITKIWTGSTFAQVLEDILSEVTAQTGRQFLYRVEGGKFWLRFLPTEITTLEYRPADNVRSFDPTWALGELSGGRDLSQDFANAVVLAKEDSDVLYTLAKAENAASIAKYGRIQKTLTVSSDTTGIPVEIAAAALKESDRLGGEFEVSEMFGDDNAKSGRIVRFSSQKFGLSGLYRIKSVTHNYGVPHTMELTVVPAESSRAAGSADTVTGSTVPITKKDTSSKSDTSTSTAAGSSAPTNTGSGTTLRDAFVAKAEGEVGTKESPLGSNRQKYGAWYGRNGVAWCAIFVSWVASHTGVPVSIMPHTYAAVGQFWDWGKAKGIFKAKSSGYIPRPGDLMIQKSGGASHIGIVVSATGAQFHTVEGNSGDRVARRTYRYNDSKLTGFCAIKWG